jgi:hypothetical protein
MSWPVGRSSNPEIPIRRREEKPKDQTETGSKVRFKRRKSESRAMTSLSCWSGKRVGMGWISGGTGQIQTIEASRMGHSLTCCVMCPIRLAFVLQVAVCECNYRAEMTLLNVGQFAGLGMGHVPKRPTICMCRYVPKRPIGFAAQRPANSPTPRQSKHSALFTDGWLVTIDDTGHMLRAAASTAFRIALTLC